MCLNVSIYMHLYISKSKQRHEPATHGDKVASSNTQMYLDIAHLLQSLVKQANFCKQVTFVVIRTNFWYLDILCHSQNNWNATSLSDTSKGSNFSDLDGPLFQKCLKHQLCPYIMRIDTVSSNHTISSSIDSAA